MVQVEAFRQDHFDLALSVGASMKNIIQRVTFMYIVNKLLILKSIVDVLKYMQHTRFVS